MRTSWIVVAAVALAARAAAAQPASPTPSPAVSTPFLEQRVVEELAARGVVLSRLGVALKLEPVATVMLVSLVEPGSGRARASTKLDTLPADREAAVAALTSVVAELAAQLGAQPTGAGRPAVAADDHLAAIEANQRELLARNEEDRREWARRDDAEAQYRAEAIRFDKTIVVWATAHAVGAGSITRATRGESGVPMGSIDFYNTVERPDLAAAYQTRRRRKIIGYVATGTVIVGGAIVAAALPDESPDYSGCVPGDDFYNFCVTSAYNDAKWATTERRFTVMVGAIARAVIPGAVAAWYQTHPQPVSEAEARELAGGHNRRLRSRLGLPVARSAARSPSVAWQLTPYASASGGGLAVTGSF